jgi:hypothetical protein
LHFRMLVTFHPPVPMVMVVVMPVMVTVITHPGHSLGLLCQAQQGSHCSSRGQSNVPTRPPIKGLHVLR